MVAVCAGVHDLPMQGGIDKGHRRFLTLRRPGRHSDDSVGTGGGEFNADDKTAHPDSRATAWPAGGGIRTGNITCDDGANKYHTVIGDNIFAGANTMPVAPGERGCRPAQETRMRRVK
jgi:hypothetical protein